MKHSDIDINRDIRKLLVRHWIDLGRITVRCSGGRAMVYGSLGRISGTQEELTPAIVSHLFDEIERVDGLLNIRYELDNWSCTSGAWKPTTAQQRQAGNRTQSTAAPETYDIDKV